jgi:HEAT repeat protein
MDDLAVGTKKPLVLVRFKDMWVEDQLIAGIRDEIFEDRRVLLDVLGKIRSRKAADRIIVSIKQGIGFRALAIKALVQIGEPAIEPLISALQDADSKMRSSAASALGKIRDIRAVEPLIASLKDEDTSVRQHVASALGEIKDPRVIEPLIAASMKDEQSIVRTHAFNALVEMGPLVVERLLQGLKETSSYSRWRAAWALGIMKITEAVEPLINSLNDKEPEVRLIASVALGEIGDPRAIAPLNALENDEDLGVRSCAEFSLARLE